jgi:hypothetical protein
MGTQLVFERTAFRGGSEQWRKYSPGGPLSGVGTVVLARSHVPNAALTAGTFAAIQAEIYSDGASSDVNSRPYSALRVVNAGNATGMGTVDTDAFLFDFVGFTPASGAFIGDAGDEPTWTGKTRLVRCRLPSGSLSNLLLVDP